MIERLLPLLVAVAVPAAAAPALPSFEQSLGSIQLQVQKSAPQRGTVHAKSGLDNLSWDADRLRDDASRLRNTVRWLQAAARRPNDPSLRSYVIQASWQMREFSSRVVTLRRDVERARDAAQKNPDLVGAAERARSSASWLTSETRWLWSDIQTASWDLRRAGFVFEAFDFERYSSEATDAAAGAEQAAGELVRRVKG